MVYKLFQILIDHDNGCQNEREKYELLLTLSVLDEPYWSKYLETHYHA
ncbi:hypothetical protein [Enterococcus sp. JM9B]|nr:hypothetical protein [Enterococcus sp. JM9B]